MKHLEEKFFEIINKINHSKYFIMFIHMCKHINIRLVISLIVSYFILKIIFVDMVFNRIKEESSKTSVFDRLNSLIKESKETIELFQKFTKATGLEDLPSMKNIDLKNKNAFDDVLILKKNDLLYNNNIRYNIIPNCDSQISAQIIGKNRDSSEFINKEFSFSLKDLSLPIGLLKGVASVSTSNEYDIVVPISKTYFIKEPSVELNLLKPQSGTSFVSYNVKFNKIDDGYNVGNFDPRIFHIAKGFGSYILCGDSITMNLKITDEERNMIYNSDVVFVVGEKEIPYGLENIIMRMRVGDKIVAFLNHDWFKLEKKQRSKIKIDTKKKYLFFEITIKDIKQTNDSFKGNR